MILVGRGHIAIVLKLGTEIPRNIALVLMRGCNLQMPMYPWMLDLPL